MIHRLRRDSILREAHASLERLGVEAIDLYRIHWPDPTADIEEGRAAPTSGSVGLGHMAAI